MPCLFCNRDFDASAGREKTAEHVFADWLRPYFETPGTPGTQVRWNASKTGEQRLWSYRAYPADRTVQGVCEECNNQWLSDIEGASKPYLLPALQSRSQGSSLSESAQGALSIWAFKTALVVGAKGGNAKIPVEYLHDFYASREPTPSTRIWITATTRRDMLFIDHRTISVHASDDDPPPSSNAFSTLLGVGHVGFYILNWAGRVKPSMERFYKRPYSNLLIPIFPSRGPIIWPPRKSFTKEGFNQFGDIFGGLEGKPRIT